jgi:hypothetical protein
VRPGPRRITPTYAGVGVGSEGKECMKVHELIEILDRLDPEAVVWIPQWESLGRATIDNVEEPDNGGVLLSPTEGNGPI